MTTIGIAALATVNLIVAQGADNTYSFRYSETVDDVVTPVDLVLWSAEAQIRRQVGGEVWHEFAGITHEADGSIVLVLDAATTAAVEWNGRNSGVWDLELTSPSGKVIRLLSGTVTVSHDVTRVVPE